MRVLLLRNGQFVTVDANQKKNLNGILAATRNNKKSPTHSNRWNNIIFLYSQSLQCLYNMQHKLRGLLFVTCALHDSTNSIKTHDFWFRCTKSYIQIIEVIKVSQANHNNINISVASEVLFFCDSYATIQETHTTRRTANNNSQCVCCALTSCGTAVFIYAITTIWQATNNERRDHRGIKWWI